jgi:hypothetical protein
VIVLLFEEMFRKLERELLEENEKKKLLNVYTRLDRELGFHHKMTLICAYKLIEAGYTPKVEWWINKEEYRSKLDYEKLICDIFASKKDETIVIEVETKYYFDPRRIVLDPYQNYRGLTRIVGKGTKESHEYYEYKNKIPLRIPKTLIDKPDERNIDDINFLKKIVKKGTKESHEYYEYKNKIPLRIPKTLIDKPDERNIDDINFLKKIVDKEYRKPKIPLDKIMKAKIDFIYVVDLDECEAEKIYLQKI